MPVDRLTSRFERSRTQARNSARAQLDLILANEPVLLALRGGRKRLEAAKDISALMEQGEALSPGQYSYIDSIYEAMWRSAGFESVSTHIDKKRKALRFG